ncbi:guanine nucleotide-binding protein subunit gamma-e-like [Tubulanus polymorphus]|uniref:guanine nucleotide-binding protein subunit gamma-e-like n=1 Tax=Tubulanus polymorphus TaxID=672921 RepID=UPI003DA46ACC
MDKDQLKRQRDILQRQQGINRMLLSESIADMIQFVQGNLAKDGLVTPPKDKKDNPWAERSKCTIV